MTVLTARTENALRNQGLDPSYVVGVVERGLTEDLDGGVDITSSATIPADQLASLDLVVRGSGTLAGVDVAAAVFEFVPGGPVEVSVTGRDGEAVGPGRVILTATGPTAALLAAERTALNLCCHLSGIATLTRKWVDSVANTDARIRDTRKTTPGLRALEKYAVRCGGGVNHRMSLSDAALIKDNHVVAAGGVAQAYVAVRSAAPGLSVEVEVDSLDQLDEAMRAGADLILLDNFDVESLVRAVAVRDDHAVQAGRPGWPHLEASGGLVLDTAAAVARTGVDYLAVGALTHSAPVLDIGGDLRVTG